MLSSNVKRIQNSSAKFVDTVFRVSTTWKAGIDRSVLRTGREFQTMDAIVMDYFKSLRNPPQFPQVLLQENSVGSQEMLSLLADVGRILFFVLVCQPSRSTLHNFFFFFFSPSSTLNPCCASRTHSFRSRSPSF